MHEVERWIHQAAAALSDEIERQTPAASKMIVERARSIFVSGDPRAWWMALKLPFRELQSSGIGLTAVLPSVEGSCWLIPEIEGTDLSVFKLGARVVESLINECPFFEYYVLADDLAWLVAESDHNVFYVCERGG